MDCFELADEIGPEKIVHIHKASIGLKAILVIDNVACGPSIGGVRLSTDVSLKECFRLARAMTLKNAAAGLAHGGGKSVVLGDPHMDAANKERLMRAFACSIAEFEDYIPGPDMGTNEQCMGWVHDEIGRSVGLPKEIGGIPLDEIGATGFGLSVAAEVACKAAGLDINGASVSVQGFGSVGKHTARFLTEKGARLVAVSDSSGMVANPNGLDVAALITHKESGETIATFKDGEHDNRDAIVGVECDIWVPAAQRDVVREDNVASLKARLVLQGANIPVTEEAEVNLHARGILSVPDFIANAGGVICGAVEFGGGTHRTAFEAIEERLRTNTEEMLQIASKRNILPRSAAVQMAIERIQRAMITRRWS